MAIEEKLAEIKRRYLDSRPDPNAREVLCNMASGFNIARLKESEERFRALMLIRTGEPEAIALGQTILRVLNGKAGIDDAELFGLVD